jgi:hypothetical protein
MFNTKSHIFSGHYRNEMMTVVFAVKTTYKLGSGELLNKSAAVNLQAILSPLLTGE